MKRWPRQSALRISASLAERGETRAGRARRRNEQARRVQPNLRRRGALLVLALVCLVLATALVGAVLTQVQSQRRHVAGHALRLQAEWLAESGLERAASRLRADAKYPGETWSVPAAELGGSNSGEVIVRVESAGEKKSTRNVLVEATYPADATQRVRRTKQATFVLIEES